MSRITNHPGNLKILQILNQTKSKGNGTAGMNCVSMRCTIGNAEPNRGDPHLFSQRFP